MIFSLILIVGVSSCQWYSLDGLLGLRKPENEPPAPSRFVKINGGTVSTRPANAAEPDDSRSLIGSSFYSADTSPVTVASFYIARKELTYGEWQEVWDWAVNNGYSFPSTTTTPTGTDSELPVYTNLNWRKAVIWCNAASEKEGLTPVYWKRDTTDYSDFSQVIRTYSEGTIGEKEPENAVINPSADGYRLPTAVEWEYAARGGNPNAAEWHYQWAGTDDSTTTTLSLYASYGLSSSSPPPVGGQLKPNSAGLYDMSGSVAEYVWYEDDVAIAKRVANRGGNWSVLEEDADNCKVDSGKNSNVTNQGFRLARNAN